MPAMAIASRRCVVRIIAVCMTRTDAGSVSACAHLCTPSDRAGASADAAPPDSSYEQVVPNLAPASALAVPMSVAQRRISVPMSTYVLVVRRVCDKLRLVGTIAMEL